MELTTAMLADGAHSVGNKLYILGGQWERLFVSTIPVSHPAMAVVLVVRFEYTESSNTHQIDINLTLDGTPQGTGATAVIPLGHAAGLVHGAPQFMPIAVPFANVTLNVPGRYEWVVTADTQELGRIPMEVVQGALPGVAPQLPSRQ